MVVSLKSRLESNKEEEKWRSARASTWFSIEHLRFRVEGLGSRAHGSGFRVQGLGFRG